MFVEEFSEREFNEALLRPTAIPKGEPIAAVIIVLGYGCILATPSWPT